MTQKTKLQAEEGKQELRFTREFELPVASLFRAYVEPEIVAQWMETAVLKLENKPHGGYQFETKDKQGAVLFRANGTIHDVRPNQKITRTFEMENAPFGVQLEFLEFEKMSDDRSKLTIQIVFRSVAARDQLLQLPFAQGLNMAHNRLQAIASQVN